MVARPPEFTVTSWRRPTTHAATASAPPLLTVTGAVPVLRAAATDKHAAAVHRKQTCVGAGGDAAGGTCWALPLPLFNINVPPRIVAVKGLLRLVVMGT